MCFVSMTWTCGLWVDFSWIKLHGILLFVFCQCDVNMWVVGWPVGWSYTEFFSLCFVSVTWTCGLWVYFSWIKLHGILLFVFCLCDVNVWVVGWLQPDEATQSYSLCFSGKDGYTTWTRRWAACFVSLSFIKIYLRLISFTYSALRAFVLLETFFWWNFTLPQHYWFPEKQIIPDHGNH